MPQSLSAALLAVAVANAENYFDSLKPTLGPNQRETLVL
jgi:hypothetical protein